MVFKAAFNQSYAMLCHPKDLRNHCAKACTHSPYNLLGLGIRGYSKEVSMAKWWAKTTPANHCQVAPSKRRDFNGKLPTGPRKAAGYVTKSCFTWLVWEPRTITLPRTSLFRISLKPHPIINCLKETTKDKPQFAVSGFMISVCPYLGNKIRGW